MVVREPERDRVATLFVCGEDIARVQAFALQRAVEALDASVGPGMVRTRARPADSKLGAGRGEAALVSAAVIGEHAPHLDPAGIEVRQGVAHEADAVVAADRGPQLEIGLTA